jgi:two-component system sensor histidine kinase/response regulator
MQRQGKILAVDDDPNNIAILEELLAEQYNLKATTSGEQALEVAQVFRPDVILLDIMMPGMDGYQVCQRLREQDTFKYTKIIMVSARAMVSERLEGYKAGADDYITKPFDGDEFLAKIQVYLRLKRAEEADRARHAITAKAIDNLRTPLTAIRSVISDVSANRLGTTDVQLRHLLGNANDCLDQIDAMINDFLDISELYAGEANLQTTTFEMQSMVSELVDSFKSMAPCRIDLSTDMPSEGLLVNADRRKIAMVLRNLIENVTTPFYKGEGICIHLKDLQDKVGVDVEDVNPSTDCSGSEDPFAEVNQTGKCAGTGPGGEDFGLTVARELVELHGGCLLAENRPEGGVIYSFEIPQNTDMATTAQAAISGVSTQSEGYE